MRWRFVGREPELARVAGALTSPTAGPVLVTGPAGVGRSALLRRAAELVSRVPGIDVLVCSGTGPSPYAPLAPGLPVTPDVASAAATREVVESLVARAGKHRLILLLDDAERVSHATLRVLREVHLRTGAGVLVAFHSPLPGERVPDVAGGLRYLPGAQLVPLAPLTVEETSALLDGAIGGRVAADTVAALHLATGGSPTLLHDLVEGNQVLVDSPERDGRRRIGAAPGRSLRLTPEGTSRLLDAARRSWRNLEPLDRQTELCTLALRSGVTEPVAHIWSTLLLLRGEPARGLAFLNTLPATAAGRPSVVLSRALLLALGLGRVTEAADLLAAGPGPSERRTAQRGWLLAVTGRADDAAEALVGLHHVADPQAKAFAGAARGLLALTAHQPTEAVPHLRRAVIGADSLSDDAPWLPPFVTGCLIDALLLAGRISEATRTSADFHGALGGSGWDIAVALSTVAGLGVQNDTNTRDRIATVERRSSERLDRFTWGNGRS